MQSQGQLTSTSTLQRPSNQFDEKFERFLENSKFQKKQELNSQAPRHSATSSSIVSSTTTSKDQLKRMRIAQKQPNFLQTENTDHSDDSDDQAIEQFRPSNLPPLKNRQPKKPKDPKNKSESSFLSQNNVQVIRPKPVSYLIQRTQQQVTQDSNICGSFTQRFQASESAAAQAAKKPDSSYLALQIKKPLKAHEILFSKKPSSEKSIIAPSFIKNSTSIIPSEMKASTRRTEGEMKNNKDTSLKKENKYDSINLGSANVQHLLNPSSHQQAIRSHQWTSSKPSATTSFIHQFLNTSKESFSDSESIDSDNEIFSNITENKKKSSSNPSRKSIQTNPISYSSFSQIQNGTFQASMKDHSASISKQIESKRKESECFDEYNHKQNKENTRVLEDDSPIISRSFFPQRKGTSQEERIETGENKRLKKLRMTKTALQYEDEEEEEFTYTATLRSLVTEETIEAKQSNPSYEPQLNKSEKKKRKVICDDSFEVKDFINDKEEEKDSTKLPLNIIQVDTIKIDSVSHKVEDLEIQKMDELEQEIFGSNELIEKLDDKKEEQQIILTSIPQTRSSMRKKKLVKAAFVEKVEGFTCTVCLEQQSTGTFCEINCGHRFCEPCIKDWSTHATQCPMCRSEFRKILRRNFDGTLVRGEKEFTVRRKKQKVEGDDYVDEAQAMQDEENQQAAEEEPPTISICYQCSKSDRENLLLVCDVCDENYCHTFCDETVNSNRVPSGRWACHFCRP